MILDQYEFPAHPACVSQDHKGIGRVVKHVNKHAAIERFVCIRNMISVKCSAGYRAVLSRLDFYAVHFNARHGLANRVSKFAVAATHVQEFASWVKHCGEMLCKDVHSPAVNQFAVRFPE